VDLWWVQTLSHEWIEQAYGGVLSNANAGDKSALAWTSAVAELSEQLLFLHPREETVQSLADGLLSKGVQSGA